MYASQINPSAGDSTYRKLFIGGLSYNTTEDSMRTFFQQFGVVSEAVVITDRSTGKSKGYGFVTMATNEQAEAACKDTAPVIDGRKTNCNLAYLGKKTPAASVGTFSQFSSQQPLFSQPPMQQYGQANAGFQQPFLGYGQVTPQQYTQWGQYTQQQTQQFPNQAFQQQQQPQQPQQQQAEPTTAYGQAATQQPGMYGTYQQSYTQQSFNQQ
eukprot:Ihof_evm1s45 gene=Ihof_evmTU1s45